MTDKPNIAVLLDGVPRLAMETTVNGDQIIVCNDGPFVRYDRVLAALSAALPADVAGVVEEAGKVLEGVGYARLLNDTGWTGFDGEVFHFPSNVQSAIEAKLDAALALSPALIALVTAQAAQIAGLSNELHTMKTAGVIEVAVRNPSVSDYMHHWEGRAEAAETALAAAEAKVAELEAQIATMIDAATVDEMLDIAQPILAEACAAEEERANAAEAKVARLVEAVQRIDQWADAYPLEVFPEPDFAKADEVLKGAGMSLSALSASNMRHVIEGVKSITRAVLSEEARDE